LVTAGIALVLLAPSSGARIFPTRMVLRGAVLLVPIVLRPLARLLGRLTQRSARGVGAVAVMHLVKERSRSAYTLALVMVVLAMVFTIGASNVSMQRSLGHVLDRQFGADLEVSKSGALTPDMETKVLGTSAVAAAS